MRATVGCLLVAIVLVVTAPIPTAAQDVLSGSVDFGLSYAKAANRATYVLNAEADLRSGHYETIGRVESWLFHQEDAATLTRHDAMIETRRLFGQSWFAFGRLHGQQDDELELDLRLLFGGGIGRYLLQTDGNVFVVEGGLDYDAEWYQNVDERGDAIEALGSLEWEWLDVGQATEAILRTTIFLSLDRQRWRLDVDADLRRRILASLYLALNVFEDFDSDPPDDRTRSDLGASFTLGWSF